MRSRIGLASVFALAAVAAVVVAAGCGSSSKPSYCSATSDLKSSVDQLSSDVTSANFSSVESDATTVKTDANTVVNDAKQDFPSETSALQSSITSLSDAVDALPASPTPQQILQLVPNVSAAVTAVQSFSSATDSEC